VQQERMTSFLSFRTAQLDSGAATLMPVVDRQSLAVLVTEFERAQGYTDPAGGYGGIVPANLRLGPLRGYFLAQGAQMDPDSPDEIYALFCECGEGGCWPLMVRVVVDLDTVCWTRFRQPRRPTRDYSGFGPFVFDRRQYEAAVAAAISRHGPE
jgi:hypothetical protein